MSKTHLKLTNIKRHFGEGETMVRVLESADLTLKSGEVVALIAPSGAGKSTLLHVGGLLERPQSGEVEICGKNTSTRLINYFATNQAMEIFKSLDPAP